MVSNIYSEALDEQVELREFMIAAIAVMIFMALFLWRVKIYDLSTAMFFAYGLGAMARGKLGLFLILFPAACLNRETTLLLSLVYAIWFFGKWKWGGYVFGGLYQAMTFGVVRWVVMTMYARNYGIDFAWQPMKNLREYLENPLLAMIHWGVFAIVMWLCLRRWRMVPAFLRMAFLVLMPITTINYLVLGSSFEVRVFAEVFPVVIGMMTWGFGSGTRKGNYDVKIHG